MLAEGIVTDLQLPRRTFSAVLDELIPARDESLPGAGSLGVGSWVEARLGVATSLVADGLTALDALARERKVAGFSELPVEQRAQLLREVAASHPGFVESLLFHTYTGYYQNSRVVEALGLEPRPPHPQGYPLEAGDLGRLAAVRRRGKLYRDC